MRAMAKGEPFMQIRAFAPKAPPVFSEEFLYPRMSKDDARFILAVAEEYERLISILGTDTIRTLLNHGLPQHKAVQP